MQKIAISHVGNGSSSSILQQTAEHLSFNLQYTLVTDYFKILREPNRQTNEN